MYRDFEIVATDGSILYRDFCSNFKQAVVNAVKRGIKLDYADFSGKDLSSVDLSGGSFRYGHFVKTQLRHCKLAMANLYRSVLSKANLVSTDVTGADLSCSKISDANIVNVDGLKDTELKTLLSSGSPFKAYKLVNPDGNGAFEGGIKYTIGQSYEVSNANCDDKIMCAPGIHVATLGWCRNRHEPKKDHRILIVGFTAEDIATIPQSTNGKMRLKRCTVIDEYKK